MDGEAMNQDAGKENVSHLLGAPRDAVPDFALVNQSTGANAVKIPRRQFIHLIAGAAVLPAMSRIAQAQAYPSRPVHWVVPWPAGGPADISARLIGQWLSQRLGQPFVIENLSGAGGNIGTEVVAT